MNATSIRHETNPETDICKQYAYAQLRWPIQKRVVTSTRDVSMAKKTTRLVAISFLLCFFLLLSASSFNIRAKSTKTTIEAVMVISTSGAPEKMWFSDDGILHIRRGPHEGTLTSVANDFYFEIDYPGNNNLDLATFTGNGWGPICFTGHWGNLEGTFEGHMVLLFRDAFITAKIVCQGTGDFEGMHLKGSFAEYFGTDPVTTVAIHNPHG
jgi:hypothetical protein